MANPAVNKLEVARYYLKSELGHALPKLGGQTDFDEIDDKPETEIMMLGEALATHYRCNAVWWVIADPSFTWTEEVVPIADVRMSGMGDNNSITELIYSADIQNQPLKLKEKLQDYYALHPDDPKKYKVKPKNAPIKLPKVLLVESKGELRLLDGSHRFIEQLLKGTETVQAYVARPAVSGAKIQPMAGEGTLRILLRLYKNTTSRDDRRAIHATVNLLDADDRHAEFLKRFDGVDDKGVVARA